MYAQITIYHELFFLVKDYVGKCSPAMDFSNYDYEHRARWANDCKRKKTKSLKYFLY